MGTLGEEVFKRIVKDYISLALLIFTLTQLLNVAAIAIFLSSLNLLRGIGLFSIPFEYNKYEQHKQFYHF